MARKKKTPTPAFPEVEANRHHDTRKNIPTEELRDFVAEDEVKPKTMLYPRDPSLDPQLVWKGKDEQDRESLEVEIVPIYIQEVIEPRVIVEAIQTQKPNKPKNSGFLPGFFDDFDELEFDRKIEFYQHDQKWANRMILGNSLHVMTSLAEKEGLKGKVQMIYIDPPYGIKFGSNWQVSTRKRDVKDGKVEDATRQPEQVRAFRDTWKIGIHSYLAVLRDWLLAARELLTETGSIFVQIGDENVHLVRGILDEVFGSANFISQIVVSTTTSASSAFLDNVGDFVLWYARDREQTKYRGLFLEKSATATGTDLYTWVRHADGTDRRMTNTELTGESALPGGARVFRVDQLTSQTQASTTRYDVMFRGLTYQSGKRQWATPKSGMARLITAFSVCVSGSSLAYVRFIDDYPMIPLRNVWTDTGTGSFTEPKRYVVQTNVKVIQRCILITSFQEKMY